MIPFGTNTVTLLHKEGDKYKRYTLTGCSWQQTKVRSMDSNVLEIALETICRIPHNQKKPDTGDLLILGETKIAAENEIGLKRQLQALREHGKSAFLVQQVKDNGNGCPLPHYAASGA